MERDSGQELGEYSSRLHGTENALPGRERQTPRQGDNGNLSLFQLERAERAAVREFMAGGSGEIPLVVFFEPPSLDARIVNQYALFSMMSDPSIRLDTWLEVNTRAARRIEIPADLKWEMRDKLDQANITERVLYPGLDGLSRWLKRYYTPRHRRRVGMMPGDADQVDCPPTLSREKQP